MLLKPIDEQTTRHLFSKAACERITGLSFIQSIIDPSGKIGNSPDGWMIDKRRPKFRLLKSEFKYVPTGWRDFIHNGQFDIAVMWAIHPSTTKENLLKELNSRNGCKEIIVLSENRELSSLPSFKVEMAINIDQINRIDNMEKLLLKKEKEEAFIAYYFTVAYS